MLGIRIMCPRLVTCLSADPIKHVGLYKVDIISVSLNVSCSRHNIAEN
jgi:hypothetical protein